MDTRSRRHKHVLTVSQLIEKLKAMPQDMPVKFNVSSAVHAEGLVSVHEVDPHPWHNVVVLSA